jgi:selenide,water dikinase
MQTDESPVTTDLLLLGGGHSHRFVLEQLAMQRPPGVRVTLVTRDLHTPYSGMLPGYIAGHYSYDESHIDLLPLARRAGARVVHAEVEAIDSNARRVSVRGRPPLQYDLLSINIGSRPALRADEVSASQFAVKPVDGFLRAWRQLEQRLAQTSGDFRLAVIGGGAGGVELALSLQHRVERLPSCKAGLQLALLTDEEQLLSAHNAQVTRRMTAVLRQRGIEVHYRHRVTAFRDGLVHGDFAVPLAADAVIWATSASAAPWLSDSGLALDDKGFIAVNACLQSLSHPEVFAAGDIAAVDRHPRPRSGVFAVRQGKPLAHNLLRKLQRQALRPFTPQRQFLSLISTGDRYAIASRGRWALQGGWCWRLKDWIDRRFIERFSELAPLTAGDVDAAEIAPMHCGGCGSKVGSQVLERVLQRVSERYGVDLAGGFERADDAALIEVPQGMQLIQSVDQFRSFVDDPYLFGRIAANHALGDLFAMGVEAHSALVIANVVYAIEDKQAEDLYQLMSGVVETLQQNETLLVGGHSGEAAQMSCGLSVNGFAHREALLLKQGMRAGESLILTRPLGSGVLFAADMRARARGDWLDAALAEMLVSSRNAARCLREFEASACTDVTGFGLAGHLYEMARASDCAVELDIERVLLYDGVAELAAQGISSSLQPQNIRIRHSIDDTGERARHRVYPLIFDPQTAGGLLASVAAERAEGCLRQLQGLGYVSARIIGRVCTANDPEKRIRLNSF